MTLCHKRLSVGKLWEDGKLATQLQPFTYFPDLWPPAVNCWGAQIFAVATTLVCQGHFLTWDFHLSERKQPDVWTGGAKGGELHGAVGTARKWVGQTGNKRCALQSRHPPSQWTTHAQCRGNNHPSFLSFFPISLIVGRMLMYLTYPKQTLSPLYPGIKISQLINWFLYKMYTHPT